MLLRKISANVDLHAHVPLTVMHQSVTRKTRSLIDIFFMNGAEMAP